MSARQRAPVVETEPEQEGVIPGNMETYLDLLGLQTFA
jgi:hypothetical protein